VKILEEKKAILETENRRVCDLLSAIKLETSESISQLSILFSELENQPSALESVDKQLASGNQYLQALMHKYSEITRLLDECNKAIAVVVEAEEVNNEIFKRHFSVNDAILDSMQKNKIAEEVTRPMTTELKSLHLGLPPISASLIIV